MGFSDPKGTVFFKLVEIIQAKKPRIIFFENVPNLMRHDKGRTFQIISQTLEKEGYDVCSDILDSIFFVPQSRPRVYIVALRKDIFGESTFKFTKKITNKTPLRPYLKWGDYSIPISEKWQEYVDLYTNKKTVDEIPFELPKTRKCLERISRNCNFDV